MLMKTKTAAKSLQLSHATAMSAYLNKIKALEKDLTATKCRMLKACQ